MGKYDNDINNPFVSYGTEMICWTGKKYEWVDSEIGKYLPGNPHGIERLMYLLGF